MSTALPGIGPPDHARGPLLSAAVLWARGGGRAPTGRRLSPAEREELRPAGGAASGWRRLLSPRAAGQCGILAGFSSDLRRRKCILSLRRV